MDTPRPDRVSPSSSVSVSSWLLLWAGVTACSNGTTNQPDLPYYAQSVEWYVAGDNAGFGQDRLPGVVLGPPQGKGTDAGGLDVLSLGVAGEIVLGFGGRLIVDGDGPDFIVFENPFWPGGDPAAVFAEPGEVAVSVDGEDWHTFDCDPGGETSSGCAGFTPTEDYDLDAIEPLDPAITGGDAFDLADLDLPEAAFVRIRDLSEEGAGSSAGFDLDAVGLIYHSE